MKLSKENIQFIEEYLIKNKVKFWDVRMELLDHIATDVQVRIQNGQSFEKALEEVHLSFGNTFKSQKLSKDQKSWIFTESIYADSSGYKKLMQVKQIALNKSLRREFRLAIIQFFKNPVLVAVYIALGGSLFYSLDTRILNTEVAFGIVLFSLLFISMLPFVIVTINHRKTLKSLYLSTLITQSLMSVGVFNGLQYGFTAFSSGAEFSYSMGFTLFTYAVLFPFVFVQIQVFLTKFRDYQKIYKTYFA
jgi:hypothetical protein